MSGWDHRMMFERYLYDYLIKNNMHRTAEIFMREANLVVDPTIATAIDVPDGFLHEWWLLFYDMYRSRHPVDHIPGEGPTVMVEQMMDARQHTDPSPSREYMMNDQMISRLLTNADSCMSLDSCISESGSVQDGFNSGVNALGSRRSPLVVGAQQVPQGISSFWHKQHLVTSTCCQEVGCSVLAASTNAGITSEEEDEPIPPPPGFENYILNSILVTEKHQKEHRDKSPSDKSDGQSMDTSDSIDGTSSVPGDADTMSDASLTKYKSSDDNVKSSSPHANAKKGNAGSSSSNFAECATTADDLTGRGMLPAYSVHMNHECLQLERNRQWLAWLLGLTSLFISQDGILSEAFRIHVSYNFGNSIYAIYSMSALLLGTSERSQ